jgi:3-dehydroquinate synthase
MGMVVAAGISEGYGLISDKEVKRVRQLLLRYRLPVEYPHSFRPVFDVLLRDKKRAGNKISLILLESIGKAVIREVTLDELKSMTHDMR